MLPGVFASQYIGISVNLAKFVLKYVTSAREMVERTDKSRIDENGKYPFLDCLIRRVNEVLTTVYRRRTHTDRLLDNSVYKPT